LINKLEIAGHDIIVAHERGDCRIYTETITDIKELLSDAAKKLIYNALAEKDIYIEELDV